MNLVTLIVGGLAVWRLSHALVKENGPLMYFARLRAFLARIQKRSGGFFDMISCVYCISFWIALTAALWVSQDIFHWIGYALAFSAITTIIEVLFTKQSNALTFVTSPTANNKIPISTGSTPKKGNDVISHPHSDYGSVAVKAQTSLDN